MEITDAGGNIVWSEGNENVQGNFDTGSFPPPADPTDPLQNATSYSWHVVLPAIDCYTFTIYDYYGDGLSLGGSGAGYDVNDNNGSTLFSETALDFGGSEVGGLIANNSVSSLDEIAVEGVAIYPNPVNEYMVANFTLNENITPVITIVNSLGQQVKNLSYNTKEGANSIRINTSELSSGIYFFNLVSNNGTSSKRFIVE
jgi:hypothetical protein